MLWVSGRAEVLQHWLGEAFYQKERTNLPSACHTVYFRGVSILGGDFPLEVFDGVREKKSSSSATSSPSHRPECSQYFSFIGQHRFEGGDLESTIL
ncbi:hypothetical protein AVEN_14048-2 [Araneus ventricosus]|nr:hypothetical protein AVEN_14048-2 [Araneus ventricosus]